MGKKNILNVLKEKERETRKNLILDAAERQFATKPFDKVSMKEIANEAQLSKSSIYNYFHSQEELFIEVALRDTDILLDELVHVMNNNREPSIAYIIDAFIDFFINHDSIFRMSSLFMLLGNLSNESLSKVNPVLRKLMEVFDAVIIKMNYKGDVRLLSHTLFSALSGILISYKNYPSRSEEEKIKHMKKIGNNILDMITALITYKNNNR